MNHTLKHAATAVLLLTSIDMFAQKKAGSQQKDNFLMIKGVVVDDGDKLEGVNIRLFKGNNIVDSVYTDSEGSFKFALGKDDYYAIEYTRVGYENTSVLINTNRWDVEPQDENNGYQVDFEVDLIPEIPNKNQLKLSKDDTDVLDFPKLLIGYKSGEDEGFFSDKKYVKSTRDSLKKIKDAAKGK